MNRSDGTQLFSVLILACGLVACGGGSSSGDSSFVPDDTSGPGSNASTAPFMPTPDPDPFYTQPSPMPNVPPGTILNSRSVMFAPLGIPLPNPAWQLQYMSTDMHGRRQA